MLSHIFHIKERVWIYKGPTAWHFVSLPKKISLAITDRYKKHKKGWGSLPVEVTFQKVSWNTSIFPDNKSGEYLLPIKASVRKEAGIFADDVLSLKIKIRV